jgi:hypothetical protein
MDMEKTGLAIFAIVAALGLVAVAVVTAQDTLMTINEVQGAKSIVGQCASFLKNSSAQFCHNFQSSNSAEDTEEVQDTEDTEEVQDTEDTEEVQDTEDTEDNGETED